jgi:GDP-L-fucose synthase
MNNYRRILVTGAHGFLGHHIVPQLSRVFSCAEIVPVGSKEYNLMDRVSVKKMFSDIQPDAVVHLAAKSGGILDNRSYPADYFYDNLTINLAVFDEAFKSKVSKFLSLMGGCSYPANASSPIDESQMWQGFPQAESAGYSVAKKVMLVQSWAYRKQHGFNSVILIPGNVYGEWDNFNLEQAHVIPALLRRFIDAQQNGQTEIVAFGSGHPTRDFVYAGDVAKTIPWFLANYDSSDPVNISTGSKISIRELAEIIKRITDFKGGIVWDASHPDGQMNKIYDVSRLNHLGLSCSTPIHQGLLTTLQWFRKARETGEVRL